MASGNVPAYGGLVGAHVVIQFQDAVLMMGASRVDYMLLRGHILERIFDLDIVRPACSEIVSLPSAKIAKCSYSERTGVAT